MNPTDFTEIPLRDIHLPGSVGWWPPAPGWWVLAAVVAGLGVFAWLRYRHRFRERAALGALKAIRAALDQGEEPGRCVQRTSLVLRRFAMSIAPRARHVAGLTGERWLAYLDSRWDKTGFSQGPGRALLVGPYAPPGRVHLDDAVALTGLCIDWVGAQRLEK
jgi:hypothetical protein